MFTTIALDVVVAVVAYSFISGLIATVVRCWNDAKPTTAPETTTAETITTEAGASQAALPVEPTIDWWMEEIETITPALEIVEYRVLVLPPATKKSLKKPISKMVKQELQIELYTWGKPINGNLKELRERLNSCYQ